ncbi:uncharacterized protein LTR77_009282 [Saxophila tyrrhenica]|uniref:Uncharacterized protein n=1 Tax=Saxophila tyrrhenica TaxID=1690608 RepID=A0AAV9P0L7_9PEZI|nr:hypothetical protein LTR77_009282 [Saxophila tyrrhenica]
MNYSVPSAKDEKAIPVYVAMHHTGSLTHALQAPARDWAVSSSIHITPSPHTASLKARAFLAQRCSVLLADPVRDIRPLTLRSNPQDQSDAMSRYLRQIGFNDDSSGE